MTPTAVDAYPLMYSRSDGQSMRRFEQRGGLAGDVGGAVAGTGGLVLESA
jgi:hypothetical protein